METNPLNLSVLARRAAVNDWLMSVGWIGWSAIAVLIFLLTSWARAIPFVLIYSGTVPGCSFVGTTLSVRRTIVQARAEQRILGKTRILQRQHGLMQIETPHGVFWEPDRAVGSEVVAQLAEIEGKYSSFARAPARPGDVVMDCGANVGIFTREVLRRGARVVIAIEPVPVNLECLRRNLQSYISSGRVVVVPKGVWDRDDNLVIHESRSSSAEDSFVRSKDSVPGSVLPLTTIDNIVGDLALDRLNFIKMDIEGAELNALRGAQDTLARFRPRLEIEVSGNQFEILNIVARASPYQLECLTCAINPEKKKIAPTLITLQPLENSRENAR